MGKTRDTGLPMAWMDVGPAYEDAFNRGYERARARNGNPWNERIHPA